MKHRALYTLASLPILLTIATPALAVGDGNPSTIAAQKPVVSENVSDPSMDQMQEEYQKQIDKTKSVAEQQGTMKYQLTQPTPKPAPKPQAQPVSTPKAGGQEAKAANPTPKAPERQPEPSKASQKHARPSAKAHGFSEPRATRSGPSGSCQASMYGYKDDTAGGPTASGERFNPEDFTAAHKSFKFGTKVKVTNKNTGKSVVVRITDRGPYVGGRCLDLSTAAMKKVGGFNSGVIPVKWQIVG